MRDVSSDRGRRTKLRNRSSRTRKLRGKRSKDARNNSKRTLTRSKMISLSVISSIESRLRRSRIARPEMLQLTSA